MYFVVFYFFLAVGLLNHLRHIVLSSHPVTQTCANLLYGHEINVWLDKWISGRYTNTRRTIPQSESCCFREALFSDVGHCANASKELSELIQCCNPHKVNKVSLLYSFCDNGRPPCIHCAAYDCRLSCNFGS